MLATIAVPFALSSLPCMGLVQALSGFSALTDRVSSRLVQVSMLGRTVGPVFSAAFGYRIKKVVPWSFVPWFVGFYVDLLDGK